MKNESSVISLEEAYSIEFTVDWHRRTLSIWFWEGRRFVCMLILHCRRDVAPTKGYMDLMSRLLSAISSDTTIICCGESSASFVKVFDKSLGRKAGVQYPFTLTPLQFERLLHQPNLSSMGGIHNFSMLRTLILRVNGLLHERWVQSTQYFKRARIATNFLLSPREYKFGMIFSCVLGVGRWKIRVVNCVSCGAGDDLSLASDCCIF